MRFVSALSIARMFRCRVPETRSFRQFAHESRLYDKRHDKRRQPAAAGAEFLEPIMKLEITTPMEPDQFELVPKNIREEILSR